MYLAGLSGYTPDQVAAMSAAQVIAAIGPGFSRDVYFWLYPDVAANAWASQNPERHWLAYGQNEGRTFPSISLLAPAPTPAAAPVYAPAAPAPVALPLTPQAGASQGTTMLPTEIEVATAGPAPLQLTDVAPTTPGAVGSAGGSSTAWLLVLGGAAALLLAG